MGVRGLLRRGVKEKNRKWERYEYLIGYLGPEGKSKLQTRFIV